MSNETCYLITMDTGEQFLAHHGVQGMKWGKWNEETAARYAGGLKNPSKAKANAKYAAKTIGAGAAMLGAGSALGAATAGLGAGLAGSGALGSVIGSSTGVGAGMGAGIGGVYGALKGARTVAKLKRNAEIAEAEKRKQEKGQISLDDAKTRTEAKVNEVLENHKDSRTNQDWDRYSNQKPINSKGLGPGSYNKKEAVEKFGEHGNTYIRSNINTYEKLASEYNRDNKKDLYKVMDMEEKATSDRERLSYAGTKEQFAKAAGVQAAYRDWLNSGSQADFDDWYDYRMW